MMFQKHIGRAINIFFRPFYLRVIPHIFYKETALAMTCQLGLSIDLHLILTGTCACSCVLVFRCLRVCMLSVCDGGVHRPLQISRPLCDLTRTRTHSDTLNIDWHPALLLEPLLSNSC